MGWALTGARPSVQQTVVVGTAVLVVLLVGVPPLIATVGALVSQESSVSQLLSGALWWLLVRSVGLSAIVTALTLAVGVPLGLLFARAAVPCRRLLLAAHVTIAFLPPFLPALGWFHVFGQEGLLGNATSARLLFSEAGAILVLSNCLTPVVTSLVALGVLGIDASLEEAARLAGGPWRAAAFVLVPCAAPVVVLSGVIVFTLAFSELGVPMFLRVGVYPAVVFARLGGMNFAAGEAAVYALPLLLVTGSLLWLERRFAGPRAIAALGNARTARAPLIAFRPWVLVACALGAAISLAPLLALLVHASAGSRFAEIVPWIGDAPLNGLRASALAAGLMTAIAVVLGRALAHGEVLAKWIDTFGMLAFMLPSSILGVGLALAWNRPATSWLYTSFGILVLGFTARYGAVITRAFAAAVVRLPVSLDEAARCAGAGYLKRVGLLIGVLRRELCATFSLALVFSLRDFETAALFYPPGGEPLTVRIFTLEANGPPTVISGLATLHILITFAALALAWLVLQREKAR